MSSVLKGNKTGINISSFEKPFELLILHVLILSMFLGKLISGEEVEKG